VLAIASSRSRTYLADKSELASIDGAKVRCGESPQPAREGACAPRSLDPTRSFKLHSLMPFAKRNDMARGFSVLIAGLSILTVSCASHSAMKAERRANETDARTAALHWLELLDDGDYEEAFEFEAQDFRMSRTQSQFVRYMQARRAPFGHTVSRSVIGSANIHKMVGLPEDNYESVIFKTAFEHKAPTAERVILVKQGVGWRVVDYKIY
jgi:Protein of unknown function (DUF4019)